LLASQEGTEAKLRASSNVRRKASGRRLDSIGNVSSLAKELIKNLGISGLELRSLEVITSRLLPSLLLADLEVLDRLLGSEVLQNTTQGLNDNIGGNVAKLVANNSLNATRAAFHGSQDVNEERTPFGSLAVDLLQHGDSLDRSRNGLDKSRADPRSVEAGSKNGGVGEDLLRAGLVDGLSEGTGIGAEDEEAVLSIRRARILEGAVLPAN
jgi:hypothetical protein